MPKMQVGVVGQGETKLKLCSIEGCNRPSRSLGLCTMHYRRVRSGLSDMRPEKLKCWETRKHFQEKCQIADCQNTDYYAKGFCRTHYNLNARNGTPTYKKDLPKQTCIVPGCENSGHFEKGICPFHWIRLKNGKNVIRPKGNSGELNHMWKGGVADYPDHYTLKKNRKKVLEQANYICEKCGGKADRVHHRDFDKANHAEGNLMPSCQKCNMSFHRHPHLSKYIKVYGVPLRELRIAIRMNNEWNRNLNLNHGRPGYIRKYSKYVRIYGVTLREFNEALRINKPMVDYSHNFFPLEDLRNKG